MDKLLPTSEAFKLTPDGMMTLSVKPIDVSSDGQFVVYEQLVVTGSGEHKRFLVNQNITSDQIVINFNDLVSNGDPSKIEVGKVVADWDTQRFLMSYRDLTDQASNNSGVNRVALIENGSVIEEDLISSTINTTANASITNFSFSKTTLNTVYVESAASNLATDFLELDTNGLKDIYELNLSSSTSKRISLSEGSEVTENVELIGSIETENSNELVVFQTTSDAFSISDENDDLDIYVIDPSLSSKTISLISHDINGKAIGALRDQTLVTNDSIYFVSDANNIVADEFNNKADIFKVLSSDMSMSRFSTFTDNIDIGNSVSFYLHDIDYNGYLLFTLGGSSNTQIDNQIVTFSSNNFDVISNINGENGNDISLEAHSSSGGSKLGSIAYFTYATNLLSSPNTTIIKYESLNNLPSIITRTSLTTDEDTAFTNIAFSGSDIDAGDTLTFTFSDPAKGSVVDNDDGTYTYTPNANENGSDSFTITVNDGTVDVTQSVDVTINAVNDAPTGIVSISGTTTEGEILTADTSNLADVDGLGALSYQWLRDGADISGATSATYTLTQTDVGAAISLRVGYTDGGGTAESVSSSSTQSILAAAPAAVPFDIVLVSESGGVASFEIYADASVDPQNDGFGSFEFKMSHDPTDMLIDVNTVTPPQGFIGVPNYSSNTGVLELGGITIPNFTNLTAPIAKFNATILDTDSPIDITISDARVDNVVQSSVSETFDFTSVDVKSTVATVDGDHLSGVTVSYDFKTPSGEQKNAELVVQSATGISHSMPRGSDATITADKTVDTTSEDAIGAFDALQALRLAVGLDKSDGTSEWHDYIAADINKDGRVGADDALNILKFAVGLTDGPSIDWVFIDKNADWSGISRSATTYNEGIQLSDITADTSIDMTGILIGDVDGSYIA